MHTRQRNPSHQLETLKRHWMQIVKIVQLPILLLAVMQGLMLMNLCHLQGEQPDVASDGIFVFDLGSDADRAEQGGVCALLSWAWSLHQDTGKLKQPC